MKNLARRFSTGITFVLAACLAFALVSCSYQEELNKDTEEQMSADNSSSSTAENLTVSAMTRMVYENGKGGGSTVELVYNSHGHVASLTQYDKADDGSESEYYNETYRFNDADELKSFTYSYGETQIATGSALSNIEQDPNDPGGTIEKQIFDPEITNPYKIDDQIKELISVNMDIVLNADGVATSIDYTADWSAENATESDNCVWKFEDDGRLNAFTKAATNAVGVELTTVNYQFTFSDQALTVTDQSGATVFSFDITFDKDGNLTSLESTDEANPIKFTFDYETVTSSEEITMAYLKTIPYVQMTYMM